MRTTIIAEIGLNHNGSLENAKDLATAAIAQGADVCKTQTGIPSEEMTAAAAPAPYQAAGGECSQLAMAERLHLSQAATVELAKHCRALGIEFLSTPCDVESLRFLVRECGVRRIKIGSGDITDLFLLDAAAETRLPVILSTGASTFGEIDDAMKVLRRSHVTLMQCVSAYPAPEEEQNIRAMVEMGDHFRRQCSRVTWGFSDHTTGSMAATLAVALGASIIEKHLTIDRTDKGPDHRMSLDEAGFKQFVCDVRQAEAILGSPQKEVQPSEAINRSLIRKSLVARDRFYLPGYIGRVDLAAKRTGGRGISPMRMAELIGTTARRRYEKDEVIEP